MAKMDPVLHPSLNLWGILQLLLLGGAVFFFTFEVGLSALP